MPLPSTQLPSAQEQHGGTCRGTCQICLCWPCHVTPRHNRTHLDLVGARVAAANDRRLAGLNRKHLHLHRVLRMGVAHARVCGWVKRWARRREGHALGGDKPAGCRQQQRRRRQQRPCMHPHAPSSRPASQPNAALLLPASQPRQPSQCPHLDVGLLLLQKLPSAGDGAPSAHACRHAARGGGRNTAGEEAAL